MVIKREYLSLGKLAAYIQARKLGEIGWKIFVILDLEAKRLLGYQFVEATESVGANIAEGYGRFHYLDKMKFYFNSRG
jgi:four helix bundle protein